VKSGYFGGSDTFTGLENFSGTSIAAAARMNSPGNEVD